MPPVQHLAGVTISYKDHEGVLRLLVSVTTADRKAVVLAGRNESAHIDRLMLEPEIVRNLRIDMRKVDVNNIAEKEQQKSWIGITAKKKTP